MITPKAGCSPYTGLVEIHEDKISDQGSLLESGLKPKGSVKSSKTNSSDNKYTKQGKFNPRVTRASKAKQQVK